ncbi:MAG: UDP-N-acetylmuramoyl-L-alanine--D-glutamate ligase [Gemmatimonadota bacterium]
MTAGVREESRNGTASPALFEAGDPVAVLGLGRSGVAAARLATALGARVYASDASAGERQAGAAEALRAAGIDAELGRHDLGKILATRVVIVSPGIDPAAEVRQAVKEAGLPAVAEVELAFRHLRSRVIGITGTNGKTTTTALCGHLLQAGGVDAVTAGNIGRPLSEIALLERQPGWAVVELSSFQLADLALFRPEIGVLLNLGPDHLDRYSNLDRYYADKKRLFANATPESRWLLNADDAAVAELSRGVPGEHYFVSLEGPSLPGAFVDPSGEHLWLEIPGRRERWVRVDELRLSGGHNVTNALLAGLAAALAGCGGEAIAEGLRTFEGLPHRLRTVCERGGVLWVNDSKATNISATSMALRAFDRPVVLCLGGRHKGESYTTLEPALQGRARGVVAFGEAAPQIVRELAESVPVLRVASGMEGVVRTAAELARRGDVVLFSPACSSYDMYPDYEARGRAFEEAAAAVGAGANGSAAAAIPGEGPRSAGATEARGEEGGP